MRARSGCASPQRRSPGHVFNLGHGVMPAMDPDVLTEIVKVVTRKAPFARERTVVVVGGGITSLAAAHEARRRGATSSSSKPRRAGGKIDPGLVDGAELPFPVDMAADGFSLANRRSSNSVTNSAWAMTSSPPPALRRSPGRWCARSSPRLPSSKCRSSPTVAATGLVAEARGPPPESISNTNPSPMTPP